MKKTRCKRGSDGLIGLWGCLVSGAAAALQQAFDVGAHFAQHLVLFAAGFGNGLASASSCFSSRSTSRSAVL